MDNRVSKRTENQLNSRQGGFIQSSWYISIGCSLKYIWRYFALDFLHPYMHNLFLLVTRIFIFSWDWWFVFLNLKWVQPSSIIHVSWLLPEYQMSFCLYMFRVLRHACQASICISIIKWKNQSIFFYVSNVD